MTWHPTPPEDLNGVHVLEGETWRTCQLKDVKPGDIIRMTNPAGEFVRPDSAADEPDDECVAVVDGWPQKNDGEYGRDYGYCCSVRVYDSMADLKARGLS